MDPIKEFEKEREQLIADQGKNKAIKKHASDFTAASMESKYSYNFSWMGRPIIQYPQDMVAMQEIIWETKPDIIVETGIAHGGSLIYYASVLELMGSDAYVLGVDIDIRPHNKQAIEAHPMFKRIKMIQGSSVDDAVMSQVRAEVEGKKRVLVSLDSNHTHEHVLRELELYAPLVTKDSYLVIFDTAVEFAPDELNHDRPWSVGDNPMTAVDEYLKSTDRFEIDESYNNKLLISMAPNGYLRCVRD
ncbi:MAG: cephalosporin hydroxylase family protein [Syntrophotalea acetylenica]|jgi:cephalosporin hydroxylase|nr:cephalosporin hydroxylase family protein [Syntrophotalea acetylenica]